MQTMVNRDRFIQYLREQLIPDLRESGREFTANDFETACRFMESDADQVEECCDEN